MSKKSVVSIAEGIVCKSPIKWVDQVLPREVMWLERFRDNNTRFPDIISCDAGTITMSYCGEPITKYNCPKDWLEQITDIRDELIRFNCAHNDITYKELLVKNGKIMLVDFGWATEIGEKIPDDWPVNLGMDHRIGIHQFDDWHALIRTMEGVLKCNL